jgi:predicted tellurium resistance membrane protein TerC
VSWITDPQAWIAFSTLLALEIVLGIDNIVFLSILTSKLPAARQATARFTGLSLAVLMRVGLLFSISWVIGLTAPLFALRGHEISGRDIILIGGGLFLIAKSTYEIHHRLEGDEGGKSARVAPTFAAVIAQIVVLDAVFSLDSVITAVGLVQDIGIMVTAVVVAVLVMMATAGAVGAFVERHPTVKILALSFLLLIGVTLIVEGFDHHVPKGYIYFAMAFSLFVELLNMRVRPKAEPVRLHQPYVKKL